MNFALDLVPNKFSVSSVLGNILQDWKLCHFQGKMYFPARHPRKTLLKPDTEKEGILNNFVIGEELQRQIYGNIHTPTIDIYAIFNSISHLSTVASGVSHQVQEMWGVRGQKRQSV